MIVAGKIGDVKFTLRPQGMVAGLLLASNSAEDSFWGFMKELPKNVKILSITVTGTGGQWRLVPSEKMEDREVLTTILASADPPETSLSILQPFTG